MLLPLKWLKDYIKIDLSPKELGEILMFKSFEVESIKENVLELSITPNRSDCLSILGLAREVGALTGKKVASPKFKFRESKENASDVLSVKVENKDLCPQYCARVIRGVKVGPSPKRLVERLESVGIRSINNVVDITNFVLFELGQPLHAFSMQKLKIKNQKSKINIIVRKAKKEGEKIAALDEKEYELDESNLVITDGERPIAIAGVIGGKETAVDENTKDVILESAIFDAKSIRFTSRKLGVRTESSIRFERGFDPNLTEQAINRAADLIVRYCGGEVLKGVIQVGKIPAARKKIKISTEEISSLIGIEIPKVTIIKLLRLLNCSVIPSTPSLHKEGAKGITLNVIPPSYRLDLNLPADIIEEVARIYGYNKLPNKYLIGELTPPPKDNLLENIKFIREEMLKMGFNEVYNSSFYGEKELEWLNRILNICADPLLPPHSSPVPSPCKRAGQGELEGVLRLSASIEIENPMSPEEKYFRASLLPNLFKNVLLNENNFDEIKIFEIGKVFCDGKEESRIAGVISLKEKPDNIYRRIKGVWSKLSFDQGSVGVETTKFKNPVGYFEFKIPSSIYKRKSFKPLPKFPGITRDLSIIVPKQVKWSQIEEIVRKNSGNLFAGIALFDIYENSMAFHINFLHPERTLRSEEVDEIISKIIKNLENLGIKIRK